MIMGGKPSRGTSADKRLKANKTTPPPAKTTTPAVMPVPATTQKKSVKGGK